MEQVFGTIERITFQNQENGYTVAHLQVRGQKNLVCVVGTLPTIMPGVTVRCLGSWKQHLVHGKQFEVSEYSIEAPADIQGIKKYLGSGLIKGIGPVYAGKIVEKFGIDTLNIIDQNPDKLLEIEGLGPKKLKLITTCWTEQKTIRDVMLFLQKYGVSPSYAQKIFKMYGHESIKRVQENPYQLATDVFGIGFKMSDTIAGKMGIEKFSPVRIDAGIEFALSEFASEGHVCFPVQEFVKEAAVLLDVPEESIHKQLLALEGAFRVELFDLICSGEKAKYVWLKNLFVAESGIAKEFKRLKDATCSIRNVDTLKALEWVQQQLKIELATNQQEAVAQAMKEKLQIITGGPGTGKSTITNAILCVTAKLTQRILLAAPTGRAAKRMSEITGKKASTIHSLLEVDMKNGGFKRNRKNPLECDLLIVDEASMIDTQLMYSLLKAVPDHARLIFVGDINQLPSVGPGNVLKDIIASRAVPVTTLNVIFRQASGSKIITNAHRINQGLYPDIWNTTDSDFFFVEANETEDVLREILSMAGQRLPKKYDFHPLRDIQVLAPMKKGPIGTENLNVALQELLNKEKNPLMRMGQKYLVGDKVMQIRNNYDKSVYNGDIGKIASIDTDGQELSVDFDGQEVFYEFSELDELVLAYAVSVHKYQGSECPCIVMPIHTSHFKLLHRNLLYTGVTRGKKLVVLVGTKKALAMAVGNDEVKKRHTGLKQALMEIIQ